MSHEFSGSPGVAPCHVLFCVPACDVRRKLGGEAGLTLVLPPWLPTPPGTLSCFFQDAVKHNRGKGGREAHVLLLPLIETCSCSLRRAGEIKTCPLPSSEAFCAGGAVTRMTPPIHKACDSVQRRCSSPPLRASVRRPAGALEPIVRAVRVSHRNRRSRPTVT